MQIYTVILCFLCLITLSAPPVIQAENLPHLQRILKSGTLRVAVFHKDFAPFFWKDSTTGELMGVDIDLAQGIARELEVDIEFNRTAKGFDRMVEMVANEEVDLVISLLSATPGRARKVLFTRPYVRMQLGLIINKVRLARLNLPVGVNIIQYMKGANVKMSARQGSSYVQWSRKLFSNAEILLADKGSDQQQIVDMVENGQAAGCLIDEMFIKRSILKRPWLALKLQTILFADKIDSIAIAVPSTSVHFHNWLNNYLDAKGIDYNVDDLIRLYPEGM